MGEPTLRSVDMVFVALTAFVAVTTLGFPFVTGYGTVLFQIIAFNGLALVGRVTSAEYADTPGVLTWAVTAVLNVFVFWLIALPVWALNRRHRRLVGIVALMLFASFYVGSLFWLFPATDGP